MSKLIGVQVHIKRTESTAHIVIVAKDFGYAALNVVQTEDFINIQSKGEDPKILHSFGIPHIIDIKYTYED